MMMYWISLSKIVPGSPQGFESGFLEDLFSDIKQAEKSFNNLQLTREYFRKELWVKEPSGRKKLIKEEKYKGEES